MSQPRFSFSFILFFCFIFVIVFSGCRTTSLELTLDGRTPKNNRIFGHNMDRTLGGGMPEGGSYSGQGVKDGKFNPAQAGNGVWTITYSKFGYKSSSATIEVHHAPDSISTHVCEKCGGKQLVICPICVGTKKVDNEECNNCKGSGTIDCPSCVGDNRIDGNKVILELAPTFSCCRLSHETHFGRTDDFTLVMNSRHGYTNSEDFKPYMCFHIIEQATGKMKKYTLPNMSSDSITCREVSSDSKGAQEEDSLTTVLFKVECDKLIESNIRFIEINMNFGAYNLSLFFDLNDILNNDKLLNDDLRPKYLFINDQFYNLPQTIFVNEINDNWKKISSDKGWITEEICSMWLLQSNDNGFKRILDHNRMLRLENGDKNPVDIYSYWTDIKHQLDEKYDYWGKWFISNPPKKQIDFQ